MVSWQPLHCLLPYTSTPGGPRWKHEWPGMGVVEAESGARFLPQVHVLLHCPHPTLKVSSAEGLLEESCLLSMLPVLALGSQ